MTYEHSRKLVRGESFPSKFLLKEICNRLDLNFEAMEKKLVSDKIRKQHGTIPLELAGKDPRFENFEHVLMKLNPLQVEELYVLAHVMAQRNETSNTRTPSA